MKQLFFLFISVIILSACETEFSLSGDYNETPIVHMLLDPNEEYHFLKLNKTFLGDGDNTDYAMIADSAYFDQVDAVVEEIEISNGVINVLRSWSLKDTLIENKEPGAFYYPEQKLYYFKESALDEDLTYRLSIDINNGQHIVTGETELVKNIGISYPSVVQRLNFAENDVSLNGYNTQSIAFSEGQGARIYKVEIRFDYREQKQSGAENKSVIWDIGTVRSEDLTGVGASVAANGELFYQIIGNRVENDPEVTRRTVRGFEIRVVAGSEDLNTYMLVNQPTSTLAQNQPTFSNVEGGIGIFSARTTATQYKYLNPPGGFTRGFNLNSTRELCTGQYTGDLLFCSDNPDDIATSEPFACN
jgi:hypothetical protein